MSEISLQSLPVVFLMDSFQRSRGHFKQLFHDLLFQVYRHGHVVDEFLSPVVLPRNAIEGLARVHDVDEAPEDRFLIADIHQKHTHYKIHALGVAQLWVSTE